MARWRSGYAQVVHDLIVRFESGTGLQFVLVTTRWQKIKARLLHRDFGIRADNFFRRLMTAFVTPRSAACGNRSTFWEMFPQLLSCAFVRWLR